MLRLFVLLLFLEVTADSRCPSNSVFNEDLDKCLLLNPPSLTFEGARSVCSRYRGQLAFPRNSRESRILSEAVRRLLPTTEEIWIDRRDVPADIEEQGEKLLLPFFLQLTREGRFPGVEDPGTLYTIRMSVKIHRMKLFAVAKRSIERENFNPLFDCVVISLQSQSWRYTSCYMTYSSVCYLPQGTADKDRVLSKPTDSNSHATSQKPSKKPENGNPEAVAEPASVLAPPPCSPLMNENLVEPPSTLLTTTELSQAPTCESCHCEPGWSYYQGTCFKAIERSTRPQNLTWINALAYCTAYRAHLPVIGALPHTWFVNALAGGERVWIGLYVDVEDNFKWKWKDSTLEVALDPVSKTDMKRCQVLHFPNDTEQLPKSQPIDCYTELEQLVCEKNNKTATKG